MTSLLTFSSRSSRLFLAWVRHDVTAYLLLALVETVSGFSENPVELLVLFRRQLLVGDAERAQTELNSNTMRIQ